MAVMHVHCRFLFVGVFSCMAVVGCRSRSTEVVIFHATSLTRPLGEVAEAFQRENPGIRVRLEPSGSQVAARKVAELKMRADLVGVADAEIISRMLIPGSASWNVVAATNEIVLAHKDHSRFTDEISTQNWPEVLLRQGVRIGRADPDTAPNGYHTLLVWQLAEKSGTYGVSGNDLTAHLLDHCAKEHVVHDEAELLSLLESRAIDYAFLFRSTAEDHHLKITGLPPEQNLSRTDFAARYATVAVDVKMKQGDGKTRIEGAPITYGFTIPADAPHAPAGRRFLGFLLGETGQRIFTRRGFQFLRPARCAPCTNLPDDLQPLVSSKP